MDKLAKLTGYTPGSASVTLGKIKRKMKQHAEGASPISTPRKSTGTPKKRGAAGRDDETPRKKAVRVKRYNSDDDEEFKNVKVKKEERVELQRGADQYFQQDQGYSAHDHTEYYDDGTQGGYGAAQQEHYQGDDDDDVI
jgi:hypothetical protein